MAIDRRAALAALAGLTAFGHAPGVFGGAFGGATPAPRRRRYASARRRADGSFSLAQLDAAGRLFAEWDLPARAHAIVAHPDGAGAVVLARRPDRFGVAIGPSRPPQPFDSGGRRHFYGHGAFSSDGRLLYTSENDFEAGRGMIGLRDAAQGYRKIGEWPSDGIGPHELCRLPGRHVLAIANGGIATHPDHGRAKLNLDAMAPALVYQDARTGETLRTLALPRAFHQLSLRHLAVGAGGMLALAGQYEGPASDLLPLVALHRRGEPGLRFLTAPDGVWQAMNHYCGSAAFDRLGRVLAISAPRGNVIAFWMAAEDRFLGTRSLTDVCGVAADGSDGGFLVTTGLGAVVRINPLAGTRRLLVPPRRDGTAWDNHLLALGSGQDRGRGRSCQSAGTCLETRD